MEPERVIVNWLTATGAYCRDVKMAYDEACALALEDRVDYTVDEIVHELRGKEPLRDRHGRELLTLPLLEVPPMARALLWFIQDNVGEMFSLSLVARFFRLPGQGKAHRWADNRYLKLKKRLGKYLPDGLINRMLPRSHRRLICIPKGGWSFCWMHRSPQGSDLLIGAEVDLNYKHTDDRRSA